ncbi:SAC domain-containing protein, partial [Haematococcus lacustris]
ALGQVSSDFTAQGFFRLNTASREVARQQSGVMRVNCIDCLDRTNVVQGVLARKSLEAMLADLGLLPRIRGEHLATLPEAYPQLEREFKIMWADHGDALSTQYAGTGAMKSGFTRTGQRTTAGVIDDTVKAIVRYYVNNYQDGRKQDAIDLLTGAYQPDGVHPPPLRPQLSPLTPLVLGLLGMGIGTHNLGQLLRYGSSLAAVATTTTNISSSGGGQEGVLASMGMGTLTSLVSSVFLLPGFGVWGSSMGSPAAGPSPYLTVTSSPPDSMAAAAPHLDVGPLSGVVTLGMSHVVLPFALGLGLFALIVENGKRLVNKPQLCPQLAATVEKGRGGSSSSSKMHKAQKGQ